MQPTLVKLADRLTRPQSRSAYALWTLLLFNGLTGVQRASRDSIYFWLYGIQAAVFSLAWLTTAFARLRRFGWSLWWIVALTLPWFALVWAIWRGHGIAAISALALWIVSQSVLVHKEAA